MYWSHELLFSILAFSVLLWNAFIYWKWIYQWEIIPHPFTQFIWTIVLFVSSFELLRRHEYFAAVPNILLTIHIFLCFIVGVYLWKKIKINWMDWFFLFAGIFLIAYWKIESDYSYVLSLMIGIDAFAYSASFKKAWLQPFTEKSLPYFISFGNNIFTIFAVHAWSFETLGMWIWTAGINCIFACFILARQYSVKKTL